MTKDNNDDTDTATAVHDDNRAEGRKRGAGVLRPQKPFRLIRDGEVGVSGILSLTRTRYTVTTRMTLH